VDGRHRPAWRLVGERDVARLDMGHRRVPPLPDLASSP
jgi:hypothetical protein